MACAYPVSRESVSRQISEHGAGRRLNLHRDEVVYYEGDAADSFYLVAEGAVRICKYTLDGRRHILDFKLPGDSFGLSQAAQRSTTAEAVCGATVLVRRRESAAGQEGEGAYQQRLTAHLSESLSTAEHFLLILGSHDAKERLAAFLLRLAARSGIAQDGLLPLSMGRQDIADHLGLTIETVCRALAALKARHLIAIPSARAVVLKDMAALERLVPAR